MTSQPTDQPTAERIVPGLEDATPCLSDHKALRERAERDGYLFFRGLLPRDAVLDLRKQMLSALDRVGLLDRSPDAADGALDVDAVQNMTEEDSYKKLGIPQQVYEEVQRLEAFHALAHEPAIVRVCDQLFGESTFVHPRNIARLMVAGPLTAATPAHQDHIHIQGTRNAWTAWVPIGDVPLELGGLALLPGSHVRGVYGGHYSKGAGGWEVDLCDTEPTYLTAAYEAGDVLLFNSLTVHRGVPAEDRTRVRLSCDYRYQPASEPVDGTSLNVHINVCTWDEIYETWTGHDELKYYWRDRGLEVTEFDRELRWQKEAICDEGE